MIKFRLLAATCVAAIVCAPLGYVSAQDAAPSRFDAAAAWGQFQAVMVGEYAYLQRPGVDGAAILAANAPRALATTDAAQFVDVLQSIAFQFADPHLSVGPFVGQEASLVPSGSDIFGTYDKANDAMRVVSVRTNGPAALAGIAAGDTITGIDGQSVSARMAAIAGVDIANLTDVQVQHLANVAMAGWFGSSRVLVVNGASVDVKSVASFRNGLRDLPPITLNWDGRIGVVRINNALGENATIAAIDAIMPQLANAQAVVLDLRNTPSGGNTTVARAIMGHFTACTRPYQRHDYFWEMRDYGVARNALELVSPRAPILGQPLYVVGGHWTGSMGEGMMLGMEALGAYSIGSGLGDLLGGIEQRNLDISGARMDLPVERLFHVDGRARADFLPMRELPEAEAHGDIDPALAVVRADLAQHGRLARRAKRKAVACVAGL